MIITSFFSSLFEVRSSKTKKYNLKTVKNVDEIYISKLFLTFTVILQM